MAQPLRVSRQFWTRSEGVSLEGCGAEVCAMAGHKRFGDSSDFGIPRRGPDTCCRSCEGRLAADSTRVLGTVCVMPVAYCLLPVLCCLLPMAYCIFFGVGGSGLGWEPTSNTIIPRQVSPRHPYQIPGSRQRFTRIQMLT